MGRSLWATNLAMFTLRLLLRWGQTWDGSGQYKRTSSDHSHNQTRTGCSRSPQGESVKLNKIFWCITKWGMEQDLEEFFRKPYVSVSCFLRKEGSTGCCSRTWQRYFHYTTSSSGRHQTMLFRNRSHTRILWMRQISNTVSRGRSDGRPKYPFVDTAKKQPALRVTRSKAVERSSMVLLTFTDLWYGNILPVFIPFITCAITVSMIVHLLAQELPWSLFISITYQSSLVVLFAE